jgi:anti-anti-sigma factor
VNGSDVKTTVVDFDTGVCVRFEGALTAATFVGAEAVVIGAEQLAPDALILDLRELEFIDSTGLRLTLETWQRAQTAGRRFAIVTPAPPVDRVFTVTRMHERLPLATSLEQALATIEAGS